MSPSPAIPQSILLSLFSIKIKCTLKLGKIQNTLLLDMKNAVLVTGLHRSVCGGTATWVIGQYAPMV